MSRHLRALLALQVLHAVVSPDRPEADGGSQLPGDVRTDDTAAQVAAPAAALAGLLLVLGVARRRRPRA